MTIFTPRSGQSKEKRNKSMIYARFDYATPWLRSRNQQATKELTGSSIQWEAKMQLSVCAKRNIIDAKHHIVCGLPQLHLREAQHRFVSARGQ